MHQDAINAITDVHVLRHMVQQRDAALLGKVTEIADRESQLAQHQAQLRAQCDVITQRDAEIVFKSAKIEQLTLALAVLRRMQFAARSERFDPTQQCLFEETKAEDIAAIETQLSALQPQAPAAPQSERIAPKRATLPAELPRIEERIEPASCMCGQCGGVLHSIGDEVSEKLDIKPIEFFVRRTLRSKLACRACETIVTTPTLPAIIERGIAAPGLLAHVLTSKFVDHLPLYRQCEMLKRSGVELSRSTLSEWVGACGVALQPLADALRNILHQSSVIHADETSVHMLDPGAGKTQRTYLFAYRQGEIGATPVIVFDFATSRAGAHAKQFLEHYGGALVVDDYAGYKKLFKTRQLLLRCPRPPFPTRPYLLHPWSRTSGIHALACDRQASPRPPLSPPIPTPAAASPQPSGDSPIPRETRNGAQFDGISVRVTAEFRMKVNRTTAPIALARMH